MSTKWQIYHFGDSHKFTTWNAACQIVSALLTINTTQCLCVSASARVYEIGAIIKSEMKMDWLVS